MAKLVNINENPHTSGGKAVLSDNIKRLIAGRKAAKREPLTPAKVKSILGRQNLSENEATEVVNTIQMLSALLFEMHCQKEATCIDNQQVVCLMNENKAA